MMENGKLFPDRISINNSKYSPPVITNQSTNCSVLLRVFLVGFLQTSLSTFKIFCGNSLCGKSTKWDLKQKNPAGNKHLFLWFTLFSLLKCKIDITRKFPLRIPVSSFPANNVCTEKDSLSSIEEGKIQMSPAGFSSLAAFIQTFL